MRPCLMIWSKYGLTGAIMSHSLNLYSSMSSVYMYAVDTGAIWEGSTIILTALPFRCVIWSFISAAVVHLQKKVFYYEKNQSMSMFSLLLMHLFSFPWMHWRNVPISVWKASVNKQLPAYWIFKYTTIWSKYVFANHGHFTTVCYYLAEMLKPYA